jgi:hypothetical protein
MSTSASAGSGLLYGITALLTGYAAFYMMMQTVNGGPWSWWGPIMLGAAILLMTASIHTLAPRLALSWLAAIAAATPITICSAFGTWPLRCWIFAAALGLAAWTAFKLDVTIRRGDLAAFSVSLLLAASWTSVSLNTVRSSLSLNTPNTTVVALLVLLFYWVLIIGSLARAGKTVFRKQNDRSLGHQSHHIKGAQ